MAVTVAEARLGRFVLAGVAVLFAACGDGMPADSGPDVPRDTRLSAVEYCTIDGESLAMDILFPDAPATIRLPVVVHVHGGGWVSGSRGLSGPLASVADRLLARDVAVATIDYRLAPAHQWPAQIEDTKCAIRFLREQQQVFGLDPDRIGAIGESAGGHLVAMAAAAGRESGFDAAGQFGARSSRLQAAVVLFGPTDLTSDDWQDTPENRLAISIVFGAEGPDDPVLPEASPVHWVDGDEPPHLIVHGVEDQLVPVSQARFLTDSLIARGIAATLIEVENAGHALEPVSGPIDPTLAEIEGSVASFLVDELSG